MRAQFPEIDQFVEQILRNVQKSLVGTRSLHQIVKSPQLLRRRKRQLDRFRRSTQSASFNPAA